MSVNISFFGASVTAQGDGYVRHFIEHAKQEDRAFTVTKHGYGSMHLRDAGMCFIPEVLAACPHYCFIDWFSTGIIFLDDQLELLLDTLRYRLVTAACQPVFLLLGGDKAHMSDKRLLMYDHVLAYSQKHRIPCVNLCPQLGDFDETVLYRDAVHTTPEGSEIYGKLIYQYFTQHVLDKYSLHTENSHETKYTNLQMVKLTSDVIYEYIRLRGNAEVLGLHQTVGPYSGQLLLDVDGVSQQQPLWDRWCYYERVLVKICCSFSRYCVIVVSQEDFDRSDTKEQVDWTVQKVIKPAGYLYYVGTLDTVESQ